MLMDDAPRARVPLHAESLAHPEADAMFGSLLPSSHAHVTMTECNVSCQGHLEVLEFDFDRRVPSIEPRLCFGDVDSAMDERRSKIEDCCVGRVGFGNGLRAFLVSRFRHALHNRENVCLLSGGGFGCGCCGHEDSPGEASVAKYDG